MTFRMVLRPALRCRGIVTPWVSTPPPPPRLSVPLAGRSAELGWSQTRSASILAELADNRGAYNKRIRKGRGPSSGKGKTSGRGQKGLKARGKVNPYFQGGQTPLIVKHGRKGFENHRATNLAVVNLDRLQQWIDHGRIDPSKPITPKEIIESGVAGRGIPDGIKLLARGAAGLRKPVTIAVSRASASAIAAVEAAGGSITTRYYTKASLRRLVQGTSVHSLTPLPRGKEHVAAVVAAHRPVLPAGRGRGRLYRLPDPTSRWDMEYYRDPAHRGYLSAGLQPGESPSLYFKVPSEKKVLYKSKTAAQGENDVVDRKLF